MTEPISLYRPPWELLVVPGASAGRVGIVLRIHHAIADGMAAVAIVQQLFERAEADSPPALPLAEALVPAVSVHREAHPLRALGRISFGLRRILMTVTSRGVGATMLLGDRGTRRGGSPSQMWISARLRLECGRSGQR
ncbi:wax ester/triacylglycerol synthase domain-containing protein [Arthrobacter sp. AQ5-05]|uniref:wax ester/triacylglycerol synthase domain-containing protein n=1 Tax=Arthrobacter sp. AQ5-05 TaxID=2184581 RepID=UPI0025705B8B|nr:wax ester/triacylglycerol synthase domain-containing protein [Arthrobacter sp. AQ5-05]